MRCRVINSHLFFWQTRVIGGRVVTLSVQDTGSQQDSTQWKLQDCQVLWLLSVTRDVGAGYMTDNRAQGVVLVFDITSRNSLEELGEYVQRVNTQNPDVKTILVGMYSTSFADYGELPCAHVWLRGVCVNRKQSG